MASFKTILGDIGHFLEKVFSPGVIQIAASVLDIAFPALMPLINSTATAIINVENAAIAAGKQSGSGEQKAALVIQAIEAQYTQFANLNGIPVVPAAMQKYVDAVVALLNSFPAPGTTTVSTQPVPPVPATSVPVQASLPNIS